MSETSEIKYLDTNGKYPDTYENRVILLATLVTFLNKLDYLDSTVKQYLETYVPPKCPPKQKGGIIRDINEYTELQKMITQHINTITTKQAEIEPTVKNNDLQKELGKRRTWADPFTTNWCEPKSSSYVTIERLDNRFSNIYVYCYTKE
jgi:FtsZ-binding cell division protein ZapB